MIEIIPLKNIDLFDNYEEFEKAQLSKYCYITDINIVSELLTQEYPIKNQRIAIKNVLNFLSHLDFLIEKDNSTLLSIPTKTQIDFFSRDTYKRNMDILSELNIITKVPYDDGIFYSYKDKDKRCMRYRVHNNYVNSKELCLVILQEDRSIVKFDNELTNIPDKYIRTIKKVNVNIKRAITAEIENYKNSNDLSMSKLRKRISMILATKRRRFIKKGKKVDRVYHSFSNLSKVARKNMDVKFLEIDIKNSQPLMLVSYLKTNGYSIDDNYKKDCEDGVFYERFMEIKGLNRDKIKERIYTSILFGWYDTSDYNRKFKELYPNTWRSLEAIHQTSESLASRLQNLEAELFNELVPHYSEYYFTLFDAVYFDNINDINDMDQKIRNFFDNIGVSVTVEKNLNNLI